MHVPSLRTFPLLCAGWLFAALACCPPQAARADDASKAAVIDELFAIMHVDTLLQQTMRQGLVAQRSQFERSEPFKSNKAAVDELIDRMTALLNDKMSWEKLKPAMTKLYADNFTEDELSASVAFYKSAAGQAMLTKLPSVMTGSMNIAREQAGDFKPEVVRIVREVSAKYATPKSSPAGE